MEDIGETGKASPKTTESSVIWIIAIIFFALVLFMSMNPLDIGTGKNKFDNSSMCNDGTDFGKCSSTKPYYCDNGNLLENPTQCGCPNTFNLTNGKCASIYQKGAKNILLKYVVDGTEGSIDFAAYKSLANYTSKIPRSIEYIGDRSQTPSRLDFKLKSINDEIQKDALSELALKIQNITPDRDKQAKIAISVVQNIPYGYANGTISLSRDETVIYTRYPYEVLFDNQGICGEKSQLLAFLLRELGYGTAIFYNQQENHESVGIKCPQSESWQGSGYCFVETSAPAIISDSKVEYVGGVKITSMPQVLEISEGLSLPKSLDDYNDAESMAKIREKISKNGEINYLDSSSLEKLRKKYGLDGEYNLV